jgi:hypothetical protein
MAASRIQQINIQQNGWAIGSDHPVDLIDRFKALNKRQYIAEDMSLST